MLRWDWILTLGQNSGSGLIHTRSDGHILSVFRSMEGALLEAILKAAGMQVWEAVSHAACPEAPPRRLAPRSQVPAV